MLKKTSIRTHVHYVCSVEFNTRGKALFAKFILYEALSLSVVRSNRNVIQTCFQKALQFKKKILFF
jgi:hypothetical protein